MITVEQLRAKIKRDLSGFQPSSTPVPSNVRENMLLLLELLEGGGGGGGGSAAPSPITYAELVPLITNSELIPGQKYLFSDFQTVHYITSSDGTQYIPTIITGPIEPLILTAVSPNRFHSQAFSTIHPQDIIHIDLIEANWVADTSFADTTLVAAGPIVPGWKGTITYRHDTLADISMGFDWKNVKFRRWAFGGATVWVPGTPTAKKTVVQDGNAIYVCLRDGNSSEPSLADGWTQVLDLSFTKYFSSNANIHNTNTADFIDVGVFPQGTGIAATYQTAVKDVHVAPLRDDVLRRATNAKTILTNNVFWLTHNTLTNYLGFKLAPYCTGHTFAGVTEGFEMTDVSVNCRFTGNIAGNKCGTSFNQNVGHGFSNNIFGPNSYSNWFGSGCISNAFDNITNCYIGQASFNSFKTYTNGNVLDTGFSYNSTEYLNGCTIGAGFQHNKLGYMESCIIGGQCIRITSCGKVIGLTISQGCEDIVLGPFINGGTIGNYCKRITIKSMDCPVNIGDNCQEIYITKATTNLAIAANVSFVTIQYANDLTLASGCSLIVAKFVSGVTVGANSDDIYMDHLEVTTIEGPIRRTHFKGHLNALTIAAATNPRIYTNAWKEIQRDEGNVPRLTFFDAAGSLVWGAINMV